MSGKRPMASELWSVVTTLLPLAYLSVDRHPVLRVVARHMPIQTRTADFVGHFQ